jgi:hypothetical protein
MRLQFLLAALTASAQANIDFNKLINGISSFPAKQDIDNGLVIRQASSASNANLDYLNSVCSPNISNPNPIPPCISVNTIETLCTPNGTTPLAYQAHAQCLCNTPSTFFQDWLGCRRCLVTHGGLSEREFNGFRAVLAAASSSLCSGTPTTNFAAIFASATPSGGAAQGPTTYSDQYPSSSAVSLYYTPSGVQGPGTITGEFSISTCSTESGNANFLQDQRQLQLGLAED